MTGDDRTARPYQANVDLVEQLFSINGDSHQGLGYPKEQGFLDRYRVYFDVVRLSSFRASIRLAHARNRDVA